MDDDKRRDNDMTQRLRATKKRRSRLSSLN